VVSVLVASALSDVLDVVVAAVRGRLLVPIVNALEADIEARSNNPKSFILVLNSMYYLGII